MKLKFTIDYGTQWGESLHVVLRQHSADGKVRSQNLLMNTDDGQRWTVETAVVASRQRPVTAVSYYYRVEDGDGQVLRSEWTMVERRYAFDATKSYVFDDRWRDQPLNSFLYSKAYQTTASPLAADDSVSALTVPLYRSTARRCSSACRHRSWSRARRWHSSATTRRWATGARRATC